MVLKVKVGTALPPHCIPQTTATPPYPLATPPYSPWLHPLIPPGYHPFYPWPRTQVGTAVSSQQEVLPLYNLSTISSVAPTSGPANGRASFVLTGTNLNGCATPPPGPTPRLHTPLPHTLASSPLDRPPCPLTRPAYLLHSAITTPPHTLLYTPTPPHSLHRAFTTPPHTLRPLTHHTRHTLHPLTHYTPLLTTPPGPTRPTGASPRSVSTSARAPTASWSWWWHRRRRPR